jgi:hypothetical protein
MKKTISIFFLLCCCRLMCQTTPSSCVAADSIVEKYRKDADRLAVNRVFKINSTYVDSVEINGGISNSFMRALLAVYNATLLPARDTVVVIYNLHRYVEPLNSLIVEADSNLTWMKNLRINIVPTGNSEVDYLMAKYYLQKTNYNTFGFSLPRHMVVFGTDTNYNTFALADRFSAISGVFGADPNFTFGFNSNITDSVNANFIELTYRYGWGDCLSGCIYNRSWKFRVYNDCSVEYIGSSGNALPVGIKANFAQFEPVKIYPNPVKEKLLIESAEDVKCKLYNATGSLMLEVIQAASQHQLDIKLLGNGVYFLRLEGAGPAKTFRIIKE